ncbi:hypothetical protein KQ232_06945 [Lacticaseibacillus paracasei]|uniref:hypothetical protein n=1 Tax=Lacticaseibacillus paracasei TaxID=1597 RepID=UPI001C1E4D5B|nr:hypothetical protein [Lacticaseibacillus paracasei]MBU6047367.1 hypothetical protein [Lacticaseibacillus paracasei]MCL4972188.1 hypothetical protein [Lacticaseibacillus paracasei]
MLKVVKRLKEHFLGKKGVDKITVTIDANTDPLMAKLDKIKNAVENIKDDATPEVSPTLTAYGLCDAKLPEIEDVELPARPGFSKPFMAYLRALTDYQQKLEQSSQRASTPHVRIEFDDINDVPHVWIDGKDISNFQNYGLVRLNLEWNADKEHVKANHYSIEHLNGEDANPDWHTTIEQHAK